MFKYILAILGIGSALYSAESNSIERPVLETTIPKQELRRESDVYPYIGAGASAFVVVPYGANLGLGARVIRPYTPIGFDGSLNFTSTFVSHYIFAKGMVPLFIDPTDVKNSYYVGPFGTIGINNVYSDIDDKIFGPKGNSLLSIVGIAFGKNMEGDGRVSFWQLGANIRRFGTDFSKSNTSPWPTVTFQYGVGF